MLTLAASIQDSFGNRGHDNQRSKIIQIGKKKKKRTKTVTVCRLHGTIHR